MLPMNLNQSALLTKGDLKFSHSGSLPEFKVVGYGISSLENGSRLNVDFKLKRIVSYHMTNTFLPTSTLLIIAEVTLLFDHSKLEVGIGLSLTVMLVVYTMYQSITEAVTKTAYIKMIDCWLLFCLVMPFFIFMVEIHWFLKRTQASLLRVKPAAAVVTPTQLKEINPIEERKNERRIQLMMHLVILCFVIVYFFFATLMYNDAI